jgi:hypothetical protein
MVLQLINLVMCFLQILTITVFKNSRIQANSLENRVHLVRVMVNSWLRPMLQLIGQATFLLQIPPMVVSRNLRILVNSLENGKNSQLALKHF